VWHFEQAAARARALEGAAAEKWHELVEASGGSQTMALRPARGMRRRQNVLCLE
jgi:hypothetical protein